MKINSWTLLRYVDFIKDEKVKIQRFLSGLPSFYKIKSNLMSLTLLNNP
jgi:hypothetical protein